MPTVKLNYFALLTILVFSLVCVSNAEMTVSPFGMSLLIEEEDEIIRDLILTNNGDTEVEFKTDTWLVENDEEERQGPLRDDLGDLIDQFDVIRTRWTGLAWDGELIWGMSIQNFSLLVAITPEGDFEERIGTNFINTHGLCWVDGELWIGNSHQGELTRIDLEGNRLESIAINGLRPSGLAWDGDCFWYGGWRGNLGVIINQINRDGEILRSFNTEFLEETRCVDLCWVPAHRNGHLWIISHDSSLLYQLNVDGDEPQLVQQTFTNLPGSRALCHDGENFWIADYDVTEIWRTIDDGIVEWVTTRVEPKSGIIAGNESENLNLIINPTGMREGLFETVVEIEFTEQVNQNNEANESTIEISVIISIDSPSALLMVNVADQETEEPIEGVEITLDRYIISKFTDENGRCEFEALPPGNYELTFEAQNYLTQIEPYQIDGEGEINFNVEMLYAEFFAELEEVDVDLVVNEITEVNFEVTNSGTGPLTFRSELCLIGDANAEPWQLRRQFFVGEMFDEQRVQGVVLVDGLLYISCANNHNPHIVVVDLEGRIINRFDQVGVEGRYGFRDLAFDGELIWAAENSTLFSFTIDGQFIREIASPFNYTKNIAFDSDREILWVSGISTNYAGIDRNGNVLAEIDSGELRTYGLAYWPNDPDGFQLYTFHKNNDIGNQLVTKFNPENGEHILVRSLEPENGGAAAAAFITNQYDIYSWIFMSVISNGADDRIDIWQLDGRTDWMELNLVEGIIEPDEVCEFILTLDATGLPAEVFEAEMVFTHDGIGGETSIPITMTVLGDNDQEERILQLHDGWNMVSVNVEPENNDIIDLTQELVDNDLLQIMKDGAGRFYVPEHNFNNIPGWNVAEGYQINMIDDGDLTIAGMQVEFDRPIPLNEGWQIVSYFPRIEVGPWVAFSGIIDALILAKDEQGRFLNVEFNFCNLLDIAEGNGYQVKLSEATELVWCVEGNGEFIIARNEDPKQPQRIMSAVRCPYLTESGQPTCLVKASSLKYSTLVKARRSREGGNPEYTSTYKIAIPGKSQDSKKTMNISKVSRAPDSTMELLHFARKDATGENMSLLILSESMPDGEIGVYSGGNLIGSGALKDGKCGIAVWGDDPTTLEIEGAVNGDLLDYVYANENGQHQVSFEVIAGTGHYRSNDFQVVRFLEVNQIPIEFGIVSIYPNPFNSSTSIIYNLPEHGNINLVLYDLSGRIIMDVLSGEVNSGQHTDIIDGTIMPSGVYFIKLRSGSSVSNKKITIVR